ncbi:unnamed protein product, partial [Phaeothamnion confervicola]
AAATEGSGQVAEARAPLSRTICSANDSVTSARRRLQRGGGVTPRLFAVGSCKAVGAAAAAGPTDMEVDGDDDAPLPPPLSGHRMSGDSAYDGSAEEDDEEDEGADGGSSGSGSTSGGSSAGSKSGRNGGGRCDGGGGSRYPLHGGPSSNANDNSADLGNSAELTEMLRTMNRPTFLQDVVEEVEGHERAIREQGGGSTGGGSGDGGRTDAEEGDFTQELEPNLTMLADQFGDSSTSSGGAGTG